MYTITFDFPNLPKGGEIDIFGLNAIFENGKTYQITKGQAEQYRLSNQRPVVSAAEENPDQAPEWELGPTLLEAFKDNDHVTVEVQKTTPKEGDK